MKPSVCGRLLFLVKWEGWIKDLRDSAQNFNRGR